MNTNISRISRRTLLRGAGVGLGLPWLETMSGAAAHFAGNPAKDSDRRS